MTIVMLIFLVFAFISCLHSISQWNKSLFEVESRFPYPYFPFHKVAFYAFNFSKQVPADSHKTSVSGYIKVFILKICQTVAGISKTSPFHEFLDHIFGKVLRREGELSYHSSRSVTKHKGSSDKIL